MLTAFAIWCGIIAALTVISGIATLTGMNRR